MGLPNLILTKIIRMIKAGLTTNNSKKELIKSNKRLKIMIQHESLLIKRNQITLRRSEVFQITAFNRVPYTT